MFLVHDTHCGEISDWLLNSFMGLLQRRSSHCLTTFTLSHGSLAIQRDSKPYCSNRIHSISYMCWQKFSPIAHLLHGAATEREVSPARADFSQVTSKKKICQESRFWAILNNFGFGCDFKFFWGGAAYPTSEILVRLACRFKLKLLWLFHGRF